MAIVDCLKAITGFDASKHQVLENTSNTLSWVEVSSVEPACNCSYVLDDNDPVAGRIPSDSEGLILAYGYGTLASGLSTTTAASYFNSAKAGKIMVDPNLYQFVRISIGDSWSATPISVTINNAVTLTGNVSQTVSNAITLTTISQVLIDRPNNIVNITKVFYALLSKQQQVKITAHNLDDGIGVRKFFPDDIISDLIDVYRTNGPTGNISLNTVKLELVTESTATPAWLSGATQFVLPV